MRRRDFLHALLVGAAACGGEEPRPARRAEPPRSSVRVALIGAGDHGNKHLTRWLELAHVVALCDPDSVRLGRAMGRAERKGMRPRAHRDLRRLLEDPEVDAVCIATPHHWHALATVWALQAGKHVYLEKPVTHSPVERDSLLAAAGKYRRLVQPGTQYQSDGAYRAAREAVRGGAIGKVRVAHCVAYRRRHSIGRAGEHGPPKSLDVELWSGPAPLAAHTRRRRFHYDWHWFWDYGNGGIGNNGIHRVDLARDTLGLVGPGRAVISVAGRWGYRDAAETPNTHLAVHTYDGVTLVQDVRGLPSEHFHDVGSGVVFEGEGGFVTYGFDGAALLDRRGTKIRSLESPGGDHHRDFLTAIEDGATLPTSLAGSVDSAELCHVANLSHRRGAPATPEQARAALAGTPAADTLERVLAHLRDHAVDLAAQPLVLGARVELDGDWRRDAGRPARPGFELPAPEAV